MTDRHGQSVSGIAARRAAEFEQHVNHLPHLLLVRVAVAGHGLLDLPGRVAMHRQALLHGRDHCRSPRLAKFESRAHVAGDKQLLHSGNLRLVFCDDFRESVKDDQQPPGKILLAFGPDGAAGDKAQPGSQLVNDAVACDPGARVYADDPQRLERRYDSFSISSSGMSKLA
jgi:hypothetical protein